MIKEKKVQSSHHIMKNTLTLYVRMFFVIIVNLFTSRVILEVLGVDDYGIYNVVGGIVVLFTFLNTTMSSSTSNFQQFSSLSIRHFIPLLFLLFLFLPVLLSFFYSPLIVITFLSLISYTLCAFIVCLFLSIRKKLNLFYLLIAFPVLHLSYGWGSFVGLMGLRKIK